MDARSRIAGAARYHLGRRIEAALRRADIKEQACTPQHHYLVPSGCTARCPGLSASSWLPFCFPAGNSGASPGPRKRPWTGGCLLLPSQPGSYRSRSSPFVSSGSLDLSLKESYDRIVKLSSAAAGNLCLGIWRPGAPASRAGDRLFRAHGELAADGGWVSGSEQPGTAAEVVEVQVPAVREHRERGGAGGVGESDDAIAGRTAGAVDHGAATRPSQPELGMAEVACRHACRAVVRAEVHVPGQVRCREGEWEPQRAVAVGEAARGDGAYPSARQPAAVL